MHNASHTMLSTFKQRYMRHLTFAICLGIATLAIAQNTKQEQLIQSARQINSAAIAAQDLLDSDIAIADSLDMDSLLFQPVVIRELPEILAALPDTMPELPFNPIIGPWIFSGYRPV